MSNKDVTKELKNTAPADPVSAWANLKEYFEADQVLELEVSGVVPSGVIVYPEGIRGFIPASHLSLSYVEDLNTWLKKTVRVKIITLDPEEKKLVLSAKQVLLETEAEEKKQRICALTPGSILEGTVDSLMPYGAFIDLGNGLSGLVHISQLSTKRVQKASEVLTVGQSVRVKLLNTDNGKISLSIRAIEEEMLDAKREETRALVEEYATDEAASTSLGSLLSGLHLDA